MIGIGTKAVQINGYSTIFSSMLGSDAESWGYSYMSRFQHAGQMNPYGSVFGQGSIIGVHVDLWHGTLAFYKNRMPLGMY